MAELFVEFFSEEIPARMQWDASEQLLSLSHEFFNKHHVELELADIRSYVTPRRLVLHVPDLPLQQPARTIEVKGPRIDAPQAALDGFMKANDITDLSQCQQQQIGKGTHYIAVTHVKEQPLQNFLPALIDHILQKFHWPKSMRWGTGEQIWVRPLHHVNVVFDGKNIIGNGEFYGHRFLAPGPFKVNSFVEYKSGLEQHKVILDWATRREVIWGQAQQLANQHQLVLRVDDALLSEVAGLVEWPTAMLGQFEEEFLSVPQECLIATMRANQKYFPLFDSNGKLSNHFILIANVPGSQGEKPIVSGNERVIRARLSDAKFFYDQDLKIRLDDQLDKLNAIQFHEKLGTLHQRVQRMTDIARKLAVALNANEQQAARAAQLCKTDLVTGMVGEFPELQGIMGRYYALHQGEDTAVADAIRDHYQPAGANADVPTAPVSIVLALADKLDALNEFFRIDEKPTGSKDPFALRRAALGIIRILLENKIRLPLSEFARADVVEFIKDRLQVALRDQGIGHDRVKACLTDADDVTLIAARAAALNDLLSNDVGAALLATYRRAANILKAEEKKDNATYNGVVNSDALREEVEINLATALGAAQGKVAQALTAHEYNEAAAILASLQPYLDAFFDKVMVNADDAELRTNRLNLLGQIRMVCREFADFSQIEG